MDDFDDFDDDRRALHPKLKVGLIVAGVAAVVAVGLALMYAVSGVTQTQAPQTQTTPVTSASASTSPSGSTTPTPTPPAAALAEASMLGTQGADLVAGEKWKIAGTETKNFTNSARPACFTAEAPEGQPTAQQRILRVADQRQERPRACCTTPPRTRAPTRPCRRTRWPPEPWAAAWSPGPTWSRVDR